MNKKANYWICRHVPSGIPETLHSFHYLKEAKEKATALYNKTGDRRLFIVNAKWEEYNFPKYTNFCEGCGKPLPDSERFCDYTCKQYRR